MTEGTLSPEERDALDSRWRSDLTEAYASIIKVVNDALESKKKVRVPRDCPKCGCKHIDFVEVDNVADAIKAAEFLSNRALGRPKAAESEEEKGRITFVRKIVYSGDAPGDHD